MLPEDLKKIPEAKLPQLAEELRNHLLESLNICGGHLSASLGCIELTIALHRVFNAPDDRFIWDIGHQSHAHKMLTGRYDQLHTIRQYGGLAPFPHRQESIYDFFSAGHSSTSISAAMGMALANQLAGKNNHVLAIIGDGGLTAGLAFEALNHLSITKANVLIIINDNQISISPTVGGMALYYGLFTQMGFDFHGPVDGHDLPNLIAQLQAIKLKKGPRIFQVMTKKGKGYFPAEKDPVKFHSVNRGFYKSTELPKINTTTTYSSVFGQWACETAAQDPRCVVITPAMEEGSGLTQFSKQFPTRFFDVGIAEQHSVTLAGGFAAEGFKPVVAIYSTFLQRAYDQLIHDVALQKLPVLFAIDRAGIVGFDGQTHGGFFDLSYLSCVPHLIVMAPADLNETNNMLNWGYQQEQAVAIRYPRGTGPQFLKNNHSEDLQIGRGKILKQGKSVALLAFGSMVAAALEVGERLNASVINMRFVKPLDLQLIHWAQQEHDFIITLEENVLQGGAGSAVNDELIKLCNTIPVLNLGLPDHFIEHGAPEVLLAKYGLDVEGILRDVFHFIEHPVSSPSRFGARISSYLKGLD